MIAWRDLRGLRDPDRFDAWLTRLVVRVCIAQATRERRRTSNLRVLPVDGPAAPDELVSVADRDLLDRGFRRLRRTSARSSSCTTTSGTPRRRSPRPSASRPARPDPACSTPTAPCGPPSRRTRASSRQEVARHERRSRPQPPARRLVRRRSRPGRRPRGRRHGGPDRAPAPAPRVAPPLLEVPHDVHTAQARGDRRRALAALAGGAVFIGGGGGPAPPAPTPTPTVAPTPTPVPRRFPTAAWARGPTPRIRSPAP